MNRIYILVIGILFSACSGDSDDGGVVEDPLVVVEYRVENNSNYTVTLSCEAPAWGFLCSTDAIPSGETSVIGDFGTIGNGFPDTGVAHEHVFSFLSLGFSHGGTDLTNIYELQTEDWVLIDELERYRLYHFVVLDEHSL